MDMKAAPASMEEFQDRLAGVSDGLPKRLRQCAEFVAANQDLIAVSTVAELAAAAGVQPSAFMRFCQIMGFSGFSEMQRMFREAYARRWPDYATRLDSLKASGAGTPSALLAEFVDAGRLSLETLATAVDPGTLDAVVDRLSRAPLIHIIGLRRAFPVASYLAYAFEKMNIPAMLHDTVGKLDHRHAIRRDDVLVAITFTPYSQETIELASYARERGNTVVVVTDTLTGPLRKLGVMALTVTDVDVGAFRALSAALTLAIALAVAVGAARGIENE